MERLLPPLAWIAIAARRARDDDRRRVDRVFGTRWAGRRRPAERRIAEAALRRSGPRRQPSPEGLADLLWAVLMKPEFQLIY